MLDIIILVILEINCTHREPKNNILFANTAVFSCKRMPSLIITDNIEKFEVFFIAAALSKIVDVYKYKKILLIFLVIRDI